MNRTIVIVLLITLMFSVMNVSADNIKSFEDISNHWAKSSIEALMSKGIVDGNPNGKYLPNNSITRAEFAKMLVQAMDYKKIDSVSFVDMKPYQSSKPHWAAVYVETALRNGVVIKEEEGDRFYPNVPITRDDMVMMICRALKLEPSSGANPYLDLEEPNGYFTKAYEEYLVRGIPVNGNIAFNATGVTTRAQAATIIARLIEYKADPAALKKRLAMEEHFSNGTPTAEDIASKRQMEITKAKEDPNYIMEPIINIERDGEYKDYRWFELYFENRADYSDDCKWKLEVTNYKQLNTYEMPRPDGTFVKETITGWRPLGSKYKVKPRTPALILGKNYYTTQALIKSFNLSEGMKIEFKITITKGNSEKVVYETVILQ